jgi:phage terminase large subunit-like protein
VERLAQRRDVYDITVQGEAEFFANGILVHNCDEAGKWRYGQETWDNLQFGLRLGDDPRQVVTTTPKAGSVVRHIKELPGTVITRGSTYENRANLAPSFLSRIVTRYEGTRLGRQELMGEELEDVPGALWTLDTLEACRVREPPDLVRVVVGVDPSGRDEDTDGDEQGIVVAGVDRAGVGYVLADASCSEGPGEWGRRVVQACHGWRADRIVAEANFGGAMVRLTIRTVDPNAPVRVIHASRGKVARAEPISALYEQGRIKHVGTFAQLEDQMRHMRTDGYVGGGSPDRVDAAVYALTDLMLGYQDTAGIAAPVQVAASARREGAEPARANGHGGGNVVALG